MVLRTIFLVATLTLLAGCDTTRHWAYDQGMAFEKWRAGLDDRHVETKDGLNWHVLTSNGDRDAPVVVLIHGFGADARNWIHFANQVEGDYYLVIPDLPGHGQTTPRTTDMDYDISTQAERLFTLLDTLDVDRFHVAGNSMGGAIAIEMARRQPDRLLSLGLVDSAGLTLQTAEFLNAQEQADRNPLIPHSAEEFHTTLDWASERSVGIPDFAITLMGEEKAANADVAEKVWRDINLDPAMRLKGRGVLPRVKTPTLILWGREDRLLSLDNVRVFEQELPDARAVVLDGVGHVPMAEAPEESAEAFRQFWNNVQP
ncbi:alpha/beta fold hydrolase [Alloalcanivorax sp. C16-2]|uniref:alpha/beta fold hydrolase n=1 Tax=Alloalcanivorax TaxID=3020832 RepID=UPI0019347909|nr:alpha/beta fold hydrolase [Alloalcanivorax marinus]MBL7248910.1 alpha/beta fold hydrolase [Alloalcanivorax marinus]